PPSLATLIRYVERGRLDEVPGLSFFSSSSKRISSGVKTTSGAVSGADRWIIVSQKILQLRMHRMARKLLSGPALSNFASSVLQPVLRILWKVSIFQRCVYQFSFSTACSRETTSTLVISVHSIGSRSCGGSCSLA